MKITRENSMKAAIANWQSGAETADDVAARIKAHPVQGSPDDMRAAFAALFDDGPEGEALTLNGVDCIAHGTGPTALWFHGGGYVFGSPETHARAAHHLADAAGLRVVLPRYRLAPEHVWPAPLEDGCAVIDACSDPVVLIGDSAGGHLALNLALRRPGRIRALALISPNTDRRGRSTTRKANNTRDLMNTHRDDVCLARIAMPDHDPKDPDVSPVLADLSRLPPTFVTAATNEVLLGDALLLITALGRAGVPVTAEVAQGLWHLWPLWPDAIPEAARTLEQIAGFVDRHGGTIDR